MLDKDNVALTPPMGWNSWDCYGAAVNEEQLLGNAEYVRDHLKDYGWEYIVCDIQWYEPTADSNFYHPFAPLCMDEYARLQPAPNRFPRGFRAIADDVHAMGLKFGIHILRGIPRQAVHQNTPLLGTDRTARDIAHPYSICSWNTDMYGVDCTKDGAQAYYDSLFAQYADWGVDFVKADDIAVTEFRPDCPYSAATEIEAIRKAIDRCGRPMVLSLSPGPARTENAAHLAAHANMWRMTGDFWDRWDKLQAMFERCEAWNPYRAPGCWPDCDMLPLGKISKTCCSLGDRDRYTNFTPDEQRTMLTLWCIFRSPLMLGGELRENRPADLALLQNRAVLGLNRFSTGNRPLFRTDDAAAWACKDAEGHDVAALFNLADHAQTVTLDLRQYGLTVKGPPVDLWTNKKEAVPQYDFSAPLPPHGCRLVRF
ncbi:MAG: glycoside hydrolase family 27 protein [Clostridia bacterium]|nr:glycoside hydrolase family 27 protein [Clostridia bacterium]